MSSAVINVRLAQPAVEEDEQRAVIEALASGQLAQGPRVRAFEEAFAACIGVPHAVAVNSGTAALHVALLAHGVGPHAGGASDDEVIVPAFSFAATANCVLQAGAQPVFVDVRASDCNIDPGAIQSAFTPRTRAVIAVHLYGQSCDIEAIRALCDQRGVALIEDAAQAVGAACGGGQVGTFGTAAWSFYATKNLFTGEGGMVTMLDARLSERARIFRSQGERTRYITEELGYNYRMTEPAAALGLAQLPKLAARNERRRANAGLLSAALAEVPGLVLPAELPERTHVWHQYTVRITTGRAERDRLQQILRDHAIESAVFYPIPIHQQPLYRRLGYGGVSLPVAERLADEVLSLPVHPGVDEQDIEAIARAVRVWAGAR